MQYKFVNKVTKDIEVIEADTLAGAKNILKDKIKSKINTFNQDFSKWENKTTLKVAIACDDYKLHKFEEALKREGFTDYESGPGVTKDSRIIAVYTNDVMNLYRKVVDPVQADFRKHYGKNN